MDSMFWLIILVAMGYANGMEHEVRSRRQVLIPPPLINPTGGTFKLVIGCAVPIHLPGRILSYGQNVQFQYALPTNATIFTNFFENSASRRQSRSVAGDERTIVYRLLEQEFDRKNMDGRNCVKKTICEVAATPLKDEGLLGELLHLFLRPNHGDPSIDSDYLQAAEAGERQEDCSKIYSTCPKGHGLLDHISTVY